MQVLARELLLTPLFHCGTRGSLMQSMPSKNIFVDKIVATNIVVEAAKAIETQKKDKETQSTSNKIQIYSPSTGALTYGESS